MISQKLAAAQFSGKRDVSAGSGPQGPMPLQNTCGFGGYDLHPQKLVQLVGCRDRNVQHQKAKNVPASEQEDSQPVH
jgi:hypothetical protein